MLETILYTLHFAIGLALFLFFTIYSRKKESLRWILSDPEADWLLVLALFIVTIYIWEVFVMLFIVFALLYYPTKWFTKKLYDIQPSQKQEKFLQIEEKEKNHPYRD